MQAFKVSHPVELIEALMNEVGYATRTRARNALKRGEVLVEGQPNSKGNLILEPGVEVTVLLPGETMGGQNRGAASRAKGTVDKNSKLQCPFPLLYDDENILVYEKPAGWVCASPNPKVKTSYSAVKSYLEGRTDDHVETHFVNKLPREASGLMVVAKSLEWRRHLQSNWASFDQGMVIMVQGHLAADDELFLRPEHGEPYALPYRTMRATHMHTMLKFKAGYEVIPDLLPALRREDCLLVGVGKSAPDPMKRGGIHLFALALKGPNGETINVKTRVPGEFLKLVKGGSSPKPMPREMVAKKNTGPQRENRRSTQSRRH